MKLDLSKAKLGAPGTPLEGLSLVRHKHGDKCGIYGVRFPEINATCQGMPVCFLIHETGDVTWMYDASIVIITDDPVEEWRDMQIAIKGGKALRFAQALIDFACLGSCNRKSFDRVLDKHEDTINEAIRYPNEHMKGEQP